MLHRFIINATKGLSVDHINANKLDTRKENLRECTIQENSMHKKRYTTNKSGVKGVHWDKRTGKWMAFMKLNYKFLNLGYYDDLNEAARVRKEAELKHFGEFQPVDDDLIKSE